MLWYPCFVPRRQTNTLLPVAKQYAADSRMRVSTVTQSDTLVGFQNNTALVLKSIVPLTAGLSIAAAGASGAPREVRRASIGSVRSGVLESNSCWGHKAQHIASYASSRSSYLHVVPLECLSTPPRRIIEFETGYGEARAVRCTPMGSSDPTYP